MRSRLFSAILGLIFLTLRVAEADVPTGKLPRDVTPERYALQLEIDPARDKLRGVVSIDVQVHASVRSFWMHGRGLGIESSTLVTTGEERLPLKVEEVDVTAGVLKVTLPVDIEPGSARLEFAYSVAYGSQLSGAYKVVRDNDAYIMTQMEPMSARTAMPLFDEPAFKTPWDITLTVPSGLQAIANTPELAREPAGSGTERIRFATTQPLPSYLLAFAVGPYDVVEAKPIPPNSIRPHPIPLRGIAARGRGKDMTYALDHTAEIVAALEHYFGSPYPFEKLDLLAAPSYASGAMENPGLIVYRENFLLGVDAASTALRQGYWNIHAHELAHQWFGNSVTMPWWDDLWLNEAFATWMASKIVDRLQPAFFESRRRLEARSHAMARDSLVSARRIREPIDAFVDVASAFDSITYEKGAAVLDMFEAFLGKDVFRDGIRSHLQRFKGGSATSADLVQSLAASAKSPDTLQAAFASFTDQAGLPFLSLNVDCQGPSPSVQVRQSRYLPLGSAGEAQQRWIVPACFRIGADGRTFTQCALVEGESTKVTLDTGACPDWIHPNADGAGYYRFELDAAARRQLTTNFEALTELEQLAYADSVVAAFRKGSLSLSAFLDASKVLAASPVRAIAMAPSATLEWLIGSVAADDSRRAMLQGWTNDAYRFRLEELGWEFKPKESDETRLLRQRSILLLAETAQAPAARKKLAEGGRAVLGFGNHGALTLDAIDPDLRGASLRMATALGGEAEFDAALRHLRPSQEAQLRSQLVAALGTASTAALRERAREVMLTDKVRPEEAYFVLAGQIENPATRHDARNWMRRNSEALFAKFPDSWQAFIPSLDGRGLCTMGEARELENYYGARVEKLEGGPLALRQKVEEIQLCAKMRDFLAADRP